MPISQPPVSDAGAGAERRSLERFIVPYNRLLAEYYAAEYGWECRPRQSVDAVDAVVGRRHHAEAGALQRELPGTLSPGPLPRRRRLIMSSQIS